MHIDLESVILSISVVQQILLVKIICRFYMIQDVELQTNAEVTEVNAFVAPVRVVDEGK